MGYGSELHDQASRGRFLAFVIIFCLAWLRGICSQTRTATRSAVSVIGFGGCDKLWFPALVLFSQSLFVGWGKTNLRRPLGTLQRHAHCHLTARAPWRRGANPSLPVDTVGISLNPPHLPTPECPFVRGAFSFLKSLCYVCRMWDPHAFVDVMADLGGVESWPKQ